MSNDGEKKAKACACVFERENIVRKKGGEFMSKNEPLKICSGLTVRAKKKSPGKKRRFLANSIHGDFEKINFCNRKLMRNGVPKTRQKNIFEMGRAICQTNGRDV